MMTPLGALSSLDLDNPATCFDILAHDKHQIAEGMVVESLFDQIISRIPESMEFDDVHVLDVETFIARDPHNFNRPYAFVWSRRLGSGMGRYLLALERGFDVFRVVLNSDGSDFMACRIVGGQRSGEWMLLSEMIEAQGCVRSGNYNVAGSVRLSDRQMGAFWGYLREAYGSRLKTHVALPRVLVNWGIQPYFRNVWNIDRIVVTATEIWALEAKHKFPFRRDGALHFGLNNGEAFLLRDLVNCGIRALHTVVVKPYWDMDIGSSYLLANYEARERALVVGMVMNVNVLDRVVRSCSGSSPLHTSVTGLSRLNYKPLPVTWFAPLSNLASPHEASRKMTELLAGQLSERCTDALLELHRMNARQNCRG